MEKNYFNFRHQLTKKLACHSRSVLLLLVLLFFFGTATAQVSITKPSLSITTCTGFPTTYSTLGNIVLAETSNSNFSTGFNITLILTAPTNFEFKASTGAVSYTPSRNITAATIAVTVSTITITYTVGGTNSSDSMTISGIQLRGITAAGSGNITRTGGTGVISGCTTATTLTTSISSTSVTAPSPATGFTIVSTTSTTFSGSFTVSADACLVVRSTSNTPPTQPVNGTVYTAANIATLGSGLSFVQSSAATTIADSGLSGNTRYYYFIYTYNICSGSYLYNAAGPLTGSVTTCIGIPNSVTTLGVSPTGFSLSWAYPTGGTAAAVTYTVAVTTDAGFTVNVPGSPFIVTDPTTTLTLSSLSSNTIYYYRILASNGCTSAYVTGSVSTLLPYCSAPTAQATGLTIGALSSNAIAASFTAAAADGYLIIYSTSATAPSQPVNGVTYNAGNIATLGTGLTFIQSGTATNTAGTGLVGNTKYYIFIYSYNGGVSCTGPITVC